MLWTIAFLFFTSGLYDPQATWMAQGNRLLDAGDPRQATAAFAHLLDVRLHMRVPPGELVHLRVTLATAYLDAGQDFQAEAALQEVAKASPPIGGLARAELLNAWSALQLKRGQLSAAEAGLREASRITAQSPAVGDLRAAVLHNLAAVEMRTLRYAEALSREKEAISAWERTLSPCHPNLIRANASLASLDYMIHQPREALTAMRQALACADKTYGSTHPLLADLLESDALILDRLKMRKQARQERARARHIRAGLAQSEDRLTWNIREAPDTQVHLLTK